MKVSSSKFIESERILLAWKLLCNKGTKLSPAVWGGKITEIFKLIQCKLKQFSNNLQK